MSTELTYLSYTILLTALLWVPYILNAMSIRGLADTVGYPTQPAPLAPWAQRLKAAHYNAVENLVLFAPAVLVVEVMGINGPATAASSVVYFLARLVHALVYAFAVPYLRTLAFAVGWASVICILWQILSA